MTDTTEELRVAAVPAIPDAITHTIQRALVKFSDSELERLRTLREPEKAAVATFGMARIAAQQNIDDADDALNWLAAATKVASQDAEDAARYRWLAAHCRSTAEHWGGRWSIVVEGPAPKSHNSEDDFDAAIDAARAQQEHKS